MLVSTEEAPEGWVVAARRDDPTAIGLAPRSYLHKVQQRRPPKMQAPPSPGEGAMVVAGGGAMAGGGLQSVRAREAALEVAEAAMRARAEAEAALRARAEVLDERELPLHYRYITVTLPLHYRYRCWTSERRR